MVKFTFGGRRNTSAGGKPSSIAGRIGGAIFFFVFFAMGMLFEVLVGWEFSKAIRQRFWKQTPCTITASSIEEDPKSNDPYTFKVAYEYEFNSAKYASKVYKRGYDGSDEYHKAHKIAKNTPPANKPCATSTQPNPPQRSSNAAASSSASSSSSPSSSC